MISRLRRRPVHAFRATHDGTVLSAFRTKRREAIRLFVILVIALVARPTSISAQLDVPVSIEIPVPPTAVAGNGKIHLSYELHLTNFSTAPWILTRVEALAGDRQIPPIVSYDTSDLTTRLARPGAASAASADDKRSIAGGMSAVLFMWLTFDAPPDVPATIVHRLTFTPEEKKTARSESLRSLVVESARVAVKNGPVLIGPPLKGGEWLAANGPSNISGHRRALVPVEGAHIAQRFAIDWVRIREDGKTWKGAKEDNASYLAYGAEAIAVADASVVAVKDGIPQNTPGENSRATPITLETVGGNHVVLDIGGGKFAFYAHLQPGSIRVKAGDRVKRGDVLGLVGNSGNSTEPHLHFHITDGTSPLGSEGLPYVLEWFEKEGEGFGWKPDNKPAQMRRMEMPMQNAVVRFLEPTIQASAKHEQPAADPADVATVDSIVAALYDVISGPAGKTRNWNRFRSLFVPEARLMPIIVDPKGGYALRMVDAEGFITLADKALAAGGFYEREIARRTEKFGQMVQLFSTYESRHAKEDKEPFTRGINSIQLMNDGKRWWVVTVFWDSERKDNPLPKKYLKTVKD